MQFAFPPPKAAVVPIAGTDDFYPVHRIYCMGRNYPSRIKLHDPSKAKPPFFFMKPADAAFAIPDGTVGKLPFPTQTNNLNSQIALVVAIGLGGKNIPIEHARQHIFGYAVGIDLTCSDLLKKIRKEGSAWCPGKGFDNSAPISSIHRASDTGPIEHGPIHLMIDGSQRQIGNIESLRWPVAEIIHRLSMYYALQPGDLIYTGAPDGFGPTRMGDVLVGEIRGLGVLQLEVDFAEYENVEG